MISLQLAGGSWAARFGPGLRAAPQGRRAAGNVTRASSFSSPLGGRQPAPPLQGAGVFEWRDSWPSAQASPDPSQGRWRATPRRDLLSPEVFLLISVLPCFLSSSRVIFAI